MDRTRAVIRRAIESGRGRLPFLFGLAAIIFVPLGLLEAAHESIGGINTDRAKDLELVASIAGAAVRLVSAVLGEILYTGAVAIAVVGTMPGENPSLRKIIRETRWGALIAIDLLFALGLLAGFLLFVIPGVIFFGRYALVAVVAEVEELGVRASFRRSAQLTRGARRLVLALLLGAIIVGDVVGAAVQEATSALTTDHFLLNWVSASGTEILFNPIFALLSVALVLELGGGSAHPVPSPRPPAG